MKPLAWFAALAVSTVMALADTPVPATVEFHFESGGPEAVSSSRSGEAGFLKSIERSAGATTNGWWHVPAQSAFGQGSLTFHLDREQLAGDLALVLRADWQEDTNIAVQLLDAQGRAVVLDLFGEMAQNARTVGTNTFIVPLHRYPAATSIVVRRLSGDLRIVGGGLYPVLSELASNAETEQELAERLGVLLSAHHWAFSRGGKESPSATDAHIGKVHAVPALEQANKTAAYVLKQPGYPAYRPLSSGRLVPPLIVSSGTSIVTVQNAARLIALRTGGTPAAPENYASDDAAKLLLQRKTPIIFISVPLTSAEKEEFFRDRKHPVLELRFARDAIDVLVHGSNPVKQLTIPQLDAIFGTELRAGAPELIRNWRQLGGTDAAISTYGGGRGWGTTRVFQKLVLKDGPVRPDLRPGDVAFSSGIEEKLTADPHGIAFASFRTRSMNVRSVAIAANSGETAYLPESETIYSEQYPLQRMFYAYLAAPSLEKSGAFEREFVNLLLSDVGQTLVARSGNLPLLASEVVAERARLGLPR
jgi:phosphate transport system substrate-binding protein